MIRRWLFLGWLAWCAHDPKPIRIVILEPVIPGLSDGYGACYGTTVPDRARNVILTCDGGFEIIYPWELLRAWWLPKSS